MKFILGSSNSILSNGKLTAFYGYAIILLVFSCLALFQENYIVATLPIAILATVTIIKDFRILYFGFWAVLPFSVEFYFGSLGTDLPTEPIMLLLTGIACVLFILNLSKISLEHAFHPISVLIIIHLCWILSTSIFSQSPLVSFKFFMAKMWYVIPFFFLSFYMIKDSVTIEKIIRILAIFLGIAVAIVLVRHAMEGFTFQASHKVVRPIFRNHVNYSAIIVVVLPFLWALWKNSLSNFQRNGMFAIMILFIIGAYFSYTRAAQLSIFIAIGAYFIFKYRLAKIAILSSIFIGSLFVTYLITNNKYLEFSPNFERTIAHTKFDNLIEATYKMEDISTMERVYRWVAGSQMIKEKPIIGFGPGSFYNHYTGYTVRSFETYVSDNPEKSGIHSYYLMTLVEQGVIGFIIFLCLCFTILLFGESVYHNLKDRAGQAYVMAATLSTVVICALLLINDLIEVDKVGPFFFLNASIIVIMDIKSRTLKIDKNKEPSNS